MRWNPAGGGVGWAINWINFFQPDPAFRRPIAQHPVSTMHLYLQNWIYSLGPFTSNIIHNSLIASFSFLRVMRIGPVMARKLAPARRSIAVNNTSTNDRGFLAWGWAAATFFSRP